MDPIKLIALAAFFGLFLVLARKLFSNEIVYGPTQYPPHPGVDAAPGRSFRKQPAVVGSDLPLPVELPPRELLPDGSYNRAEIANYYFKTLDLVTGPPDPLCFCDEFYIELVMPETAGATHGPVSWTNTYVVATPAGLQKMLESEQRHCLIWSGMTVIIPRWDIPGLLKAIFEDAMDDDVPERTQSVSSAG
jgi:hypothetical protein